VKLRVVDDAAAFLDAAAPILLADEARHNLILGIAGTLRDDPALYPEQRLWLVEDGTEVAGAALRTPPYNLVLARPRSDEALEQLAAAIDDDFPGVVGALPEVEVFAAAWAERTGAAPRLVHRQGVYALKRVRPVSGVPGQMRPATENDRPLLLDWSRAFGVEALHEDPPDEERVVRGVEHRLTSSRAGLVLWDDGGPVSLAGFGGHTPNGIRIGPVYTPPERRGRGYASALVAELSAELLSGGRRFCFLYTDLANPTANRIYERIGYQRVCESAEIAFEAGS
jgi:predicted GNAT family acetyltransferase